MDLRTRLMNAKNKLLHLRFLCKFMQRYHLGNRQREGRQSWFFLMICWHRGGYCNPVQTHLSFHRGGLAAWEERSKLRNNKAAASYRTPKVRGFDLKTHESCTIPQPNPHTPKAIRRHIGARCARPGGRRPPLQQQKQRSKNHIEAGFQASAAGVPQRDRGFEGVIRDQ